MWSFGCRSAQHFKSPRRDYCENAVGKGRHASAQRAAATRGKNLTGSGTATLFRNAATQPAVLSDHCRNGDSMGSFVIIWSFRPLSSHG